MSIFNLLKKKDTPPPAQSAILAMPLFLNNEMLRMGAVIAHLKEHWNLEVPEVDLDGDATAFKLGGEMVATMFLPAPVPANDIEGSAQYAYNWPDAMKQLQPHTGHGIITIMSSNTSAVNRYKLLTMLLHSVLATTNAVGVYQGAQTLLIPREQYLSGAEGLKTGATPVQLWVYLGLRNGPSGNSVYTHGLKAFGKQEMEIVNSKLEITEIYDFLYNICSYVISSDVTFKNGETLGYTQDQKVKITASKGIFVEGQTLKLEL